eukprot:SAG31_NODE_40262_length_281_cov_16.549451_1_plen_51_part_10
MSTAGSSQSARQERRSGDWQEEVKQGPYERIRRVRPVNVVQDVREAAAAPE